MGDPGRPGRPTGGLVALHLDSFDAAFRLVSETLPRFARLIDRGRNVDFWQNGSSVIVSWGEGVSTAAKDAAANPALSVAPQATSWLKSGKPAPQRLGIIWPARCWPLGPDANTKSAAWSVLAEDPPAVWCGWNLETHALDSLRWPSLDRRIHRFLEQIKLDGPPAN